MDDCRGIWKKAVERGAKNIRAPYELKDEHGVVVLATVATYGDVEHSKEYHFLFFVFGFSFKSMFFLLTLFVVRSFFFRLAFVERTNYSGPFLPGYAPVSVDPIIQLL